MSADTDLPVNTPLERYVALAPGPSPMVCCMVIWAFGLAHDGCRSTCESSSKIISGGASIWIENSGMAPPSGSRLGGGVHRVDEPADAVPTSSLEEPSKEREFPVGGLGRRLVVDRLDARCSFGSRIPARCTHAAELPVAPEGGRDDLFGRARLRADVLSDRDPAFDDRVAKRAEA